VPFVWRKHKFQKILRRGLLYDLDGKPIESPYMFNCRTFGQQYTWTVSRITRAFFEAQVRGCGAQPPRSEHKPRAASVSADFPLGNVPTARVFVQLRTG
jgi:hypothetical protein